jgi:hypothetical protein
MEVPEPLALLAGAGVHVAMVASEVDADLPVQQVEEEEEEEELSFQAVTAPALAVPALAARARGRAARADSCVAETVEMRVTTATMESVMAEEGAGEEPLLTQIFRALWDVWGTAGMAAMGVGVAAEPLMEDVAVLAVGVVAVLWD